MKTIIAKKSFMDGVSRGEITQTLRFWKRKLNIYPGEIVALFNYRDKIPVRITSIYQKPLVMLTKNEANANGYSSANKLIEIFYEYCKSLDAVITVIKFEPV